MECAVHRIYSESIASVLWLYITDFLLHQRHEDEPLTHNCKHTNTIAHVDDNNNVEDFFLSEEGGGSVEVHDGLIVYI